MIRMKALQVLKMNLTYSLGDQNKLYRNIEKELVAIASWCEDVLEEHDVSKFL